MSIEREAQWEAAKTAEKATETQWRALWQTAYDGAQGFGRAQPNHKDITQLAMNFTQLAAYIPVVRASRKALAAFRDLPEAVAAREALKCAAWRKAQWISQTKVRLEHMHTLLWRHRADEYENGVKQEITSLRGLAQKETGKDVDWHVAMTNEIKKCSLLKKLSSYEWHVITCAQIILDDTWVDGINQ